MNFNKIAYILIVLGGVSSSYGWLFEKGEGVVIGFAFGVGAASLYFVRWIMGKTVR